MRRDALAYLAIGFAGWLLIVATDGPTGTENVRLSDTIEFDPIRAVAVGSSVALGYGAFFLFRPYVVDRFPVE